MDSQTYPAQVTADLNRLQEQLNELHQRFVIAPTEENERNSHAYDADMVVRGR